jgi:transposase-like protein
MRDEKRYYGSTFRREAVALIGPTRSMTSVARDLGVPVSNLSRWYKTQMGRTKQPRPGATNAAPPAKPSGPVGRETADQKIARLEAENAVLRQKTEQLEKKTEQLEMDRAILKKAAAFFAKESE